MLNGRPFLKINFSLDFLYYLIALIGLMGLSFIVFSPYMPYSIKLQTGEMAIQTIVSPRYIEFQTENDLIKTKELQQQRASLVTAIYSIDESINKEIISTIVNFFTTAKQFRSQIETDVPKPTPSELKFLSRKNRRTIESLSHKDISSLEYVAIQNTKKLLSKGIKIIHPKRIYSQVKVDIQILGLGSSTEQLLNAIIMKHIKPNMVYDEAKTSDLKRKEVDATTPFTTILKKGEPIVYSEEIVTLPHIETMKALNIYGVKANLYKYFGILLVGALLFLLVERFIYYFSPKIYSQKKYFLLIYIVILLVVSLARLIQLIPDMNVIGSLQLLIPISISSIIIAVVISPNIALLCGTVTSIFITFMYQNDIYLFFYLFFASCATTFATHRVYKRTELIKAGYIIGLFNIVFIMTIGLLREINDPLWYALSALVGFSNGILSSMISLAITPYFEQAFNITTPQSLQEHSNINHPLMKRLLLTAPGTYQHSLMVANLAEAAAEAIYANPVLARTGAYFHDIGKLKRPQFYTENQFANENPHDSLTPRMSKIIIASHPKDGVELSNKYKLPSILKDFIMQHHGTSLVSFFYAQALHAESSKDSEPTKEEFRYPGPKPQFKESGIVMLSDSVEAAVRSLEKPTPTKIENLVEKIVTDRITDDQLSDCPLTFKDIETIKHTFLSVFKGIHHSRIDYQEELSQMFESQSEAPNDST
ncbi:MAG: HDIG domain-containing protein [Candidatus Margulisbacteria bacterium]|nr:HDIG domain-containing protein [Candidatus Margulisiibacteriota bacterium]